MAGAGRAFKRGLQHERSVIDRIVRTPSLPVDDTTPRSQGALSHNSGAYRCGRQRSPANKRKKKTIGETSKWTIPPSIRSTRDLQRGTFELGKQELPSSRGKWFFRDVTPAAASLSPAHGVV